MVAQGTALRQRCSGHRAGMIWLFAMRYLGAVVAGMAGAAAGWFVTAALAAWIAGLSGMSDFEGERAMFAGLFVGPIGGLVCMILAIWGALRIGKGRVPLGATLGRVGLVVAGPAPPAGAGAGLRRAPRRSALYRAAPSA